MSKLLKGLLILMASAGLVAGVAASASATPSKVTPCTTCHTGPVLTVTALVTAIDQIAATYAVSSVGADAISVFKGGTKVVQIRAASGSFTVPVGSTYVIHAVKGPKMSSGIGTKSIAPQAPVLDTIAPTTSSDAKLSYAVSAILSFSASDNAGGSGVASTYFKVDGGAVQAGSGVTVSTPGTHTVEFWSVDGAGNVESPRNAATFTVGVALPSTLSLRTSAGTVTYGGSAVLTGMLVGTTAISGRQLTLESSTDGKSWKSASTTYETDALGEVRVTVNLTTRRYYRLQFVGDSTWAGGASASVIVTPRVYLTRPAAPTSVKRAKAFSAYGYIKPRHTAGTYPVAIKAYRYQSGKWVLRKTVLAKASNYSTYTKYNKSLTLPYAGRWRIRAYHAADSKNAATYSSYRYVTVK